MAVPRTIGRGRVARLCEAMFCGRKWMAAWTWSWWKTSGEGLRGGKVQRGVGRDWFRQATEGDSAPDEGGRGRHPGGRPSAGTRGCGRQSWWTQRKALWQMSRVLPEWTMELVELLIGMWSPKASHLISSHLISSHLISSHLISPHLISSHLISSHPISSHLISSHLISSHHITSHHIRSDQIRSDQIRIR